MLKVANPIPRQASALTNWALRTYCFEPEPISEHETIEFLNLQSRRNIRSEVLFRATFDRVYDVNHATRDNDHRVGVRMSPNSF